VEVIQGGVDVSKTYLHNAGIIFFLPEVFPLENSCPSGSRTSDSCDVGTWRKNPCIIDETANLKLAAKKELFGKIYECGQTCIALIIS
jgi:aldehyde dehydrogenase (NAD+)